MIPTVTALDAVSARTPAVRVPIESLAEPLGLTDIQVRRFHGLGETGLDPERSQADLPRAAADDAVTWQRLCLPVDFPVERVPLSNAPVNGHLFGADAFADHAAAHERGLPRAGVRYLVGAVGAGAGATFSAMVFQHWVRSALEATMTAPDARGDTESPRHGHPPEPRLHRHAVVLRGVPVQRHAVHRAAPGPRPPAAAGAGGGRRAGRVALRLDGDAAARAPRRRPALR
ncbi:hypothetical protein AB0H12_20700 [Actinosynnema sp. NPDC023794]